MSTNPPRAGAAEKSSEAQRGSKARRSRDLVQGLERGLAVVRAFSQESPNLTIAQVAERTRMPRAGARRYLMTLQALGYVVQNRDRFSLTPRLLELGFSYLTTLDVATVCPPFMEQVTATLHESCSVSVLDENVVVYVARMPAKRIMSISLAVGSRLPAHATSMGKVLLSHLSPEELDRYFETATFQRFTSRTIVDPERLREVLVETRRQGWALANEESEVGVRSIAVPIVNREGLVRAAINASGHASRVSITQLRRVYLPVVQAAARGISQALGAPA
jgi:IclR family pca regulon transcriptional regulator